MIDTAVIPSAGYGTRLLPITKVIAKAVLPLGTIPILSEVLWEAYNAGLEKAIVVTHWREDTIMALIEREAIELEKWLMSRGRGDLVKVMRNIVPPMEVIFVRQEKLDGLGGAILRAEKHIDGPFCVLLSDNIIFEEKCGSLMRRMIRVFTRMKPETLLSVSRVPQDRVSNFGVIGVREAYSIEGSKVYVVGDIIEKPKPSEAPSSMAVVGRYVFSEEIFDYLKRAPLVGMEIDETQAFKAQILDGKDVLALDIGDLKWFDVGKIDGYFKAFVLNVARREGLEHVRKWLGEIL